MFGRRSGPRRASRRCRSYIRRIGLTGDRASGLVDDDVQVELLKAATGSGCQRVRRVGSRAGRRRTGAAHCPPARGRTGGRNFLRRASSCWPVVRSSLRCSGRRADRRPNPTVGLPCWRRHRTAGPTRPRRKPARKGQATQPAPVAALREHYLESNIPPACDCSDHETAKPIAALSYLI